MAPTGPVICSAYSNSPERGGLSLGVLLIPTGEHVYSITSTINVASDKQGNRYFLKPIHLPDKEHFQLAYLDSVGIPVPKVLTNSSLSLMATPFSGNTLSSVVASLEQREAQRLLFKTGALLRQVHQVLQTNPPIDEMVCTTYKPTAHIVDNFYYKHIGIIDLQQYSEYKTSVFRTRFNKLAPKDESVMAEICTDKPFIPPIPEHRQTAPKRLIDFANELASSFLNKLKPHIIAFTPQGGQPKPFLDFVDKQLFEGDYKPDNLLVTQSNSEKKVVIIDPGISRGVIQFDLAKFTARFLLGRYSAHDQDLLSNFFEGYGERPAAEEPEYGPLNFVDLIHMDILNILRSYAKRFNQGDKRYSLVRSLGSDQFCLETEYLLEKAA